MLLLLGGCGTTESIPSPLTANDEAAIYTLIFHDLAGDDGVLLSETNRGDGPGDQTIDCAMTEPYLLLEMPTIKEEVIPAFCALNQTSHPINPAVLDLLAFEIHDSKAPAPSTMVRVSSIQIDSHKTQALVFADYQNSEFLYGAYFLLINHNGTWTVLYEVLAYIS